MVEVAVFIVVLLAALVGFKALDDWHRRKAWRDAHDYARRWHERRRQP
jgi:hypothetical protein